MAKRRQEKWHLPTRRRALPNRIGGEKTDPGAPPDRAPAAPETHLPIEESLAAKPPDARKGIPGEPAKEPQRASSLCPRTELKSYPNDRIESIKT